MHTNLVTKLRNIVHDYLLLLLLFSADDDMFEFLNGYSFLAAESSSWLCFASARSIIVNSFLLIFPSSL